MFAVHKWGLLCVLALSQAALADDPLWLSDAPPGPRGDGGMQHSHGAAGRGARETGLWLRQGANPVTAQYFEADGEAVGRLFAPGRSLSVLMPENTGKGTRLSFAAADEGFYNVYLTRHRLVNGGLEVSVAKAEVLNHSCRNGHDDVESKVRLNYLEDTPLEIVRERMPKENLHTRISFGDEVVLRVLAQGKPVAGVEVTLHTASGWRNGAISDQEGRVRFTMIRDYFPAWEEFETRHRERFLAVAALERSEAGIWNGSRYSGIRYVATLPGSYYPSSRDYSSYGYGLLMGSSAFVFTGVAVYLYRRRRARPLREVRFDE